MKTVQFYFALLFCNFIFADFSCSGQDVKISTTEPVSVEAREKNKESVIIKLEELLKPLDLETVKKISPQEIPPYIKVVDGTDGRSTIIYRCRYMKSKVAIDALEGIVSMSGTVEEAADQNLIVVNDVGEKKEELKNTLMLMDFQTPQILVEAKIIEVDIDEGMDRDIRVQYTKTDVGDGLTSKAGFNLSAPTQNPQPTQGANFNMYPYSKGWVGQNMKDLNLFMRWLKTARDARILSSPNMVVDLGTTASMITGEDIPITQTQVNGGTVTTSTQFKRVGVKLNVTPVLINKDIVKLQINPEVSTIIRYETTNQNGVEVINPVIAIRNINTQLTASDNDIIMLGGLYSNETIKTTRKTPILGDMPFFGELFSAVNFSDVKKQLVFFLKIKILSESAMTDSLLSTNDIDKTAVETREIGDIIRDSDKVFPTPKEKKEEKEEEKGTQPLTVPGK